jgi:hypothetical protein
VGDKTSPTLWVFTPTIWLIRPTSQADSADVPIKLTMPEAEIQPYRMADDLGWEAVMLVTVSRWCIHTTSMAHQQGIGQAAQQVDKASFRQRVQS